MLRGNRSRAAALAFLAAALASCAKDFDQLEPFPCGKDQTCPASYHCLKDVGCVHTRNLRNYVPFACNADDTCVMGYFCVEKVGCVPRDECDLIDQDCPADRPKCMVASEMIGNGQVDKASVSFSCGVVEGTGAQGEACSFVGLQNDTCAPGLLCIGDVCHSYCGRDRACAQGYSCGAFVVSGSSPEVRFGSCFHICDLGQPCTFFGGSDGHCIIVNGYAPSPWATVCGQAAGKGAGESCEDHSDCGIGLECDTSVSQCAAACTTSTPCASGTCNWAFSDLGGICK